MKIIGNLDRGLMVALIIFSLLFLPFIDSFPHLDGNIDFVKSHDFFLSFDQYLQNWRSVHPPFKYLLTDVIYTLFGFNYYFFNLLGYLLGILGILAFFHLIKQLFNRQVAQIGALLLASSPLFLANGIFALIDYLLAILIIISLYFYYQRQYLFYVLFASLTLLTKESGVLLPMIILLVEFIFLFKQEKINLQQNFILTFPLMVFIVWIGILRLNHKGLWGDWIFAETASKGGLYTIIYNLLTFKFLNQYTFSHWRQLLFLNFNWVLLPMGVVGLLANFKKIVIIDEHDLQKIKTIMTIFLLIVANIFTVLAFPTYTIPRYALPVTTLSYLFVALGISWLTTNFEHLKTVFYLGFSAVVLLSLFFSVDPLATKIWGKTNVLGQEVYALNKTLAGNDGITYNWQYLMVLKKRTRQIMEADKRRGAVLSDDCFWVFPDPNNDLKTLEFLKLSIPKESRCLPL